MGRNSRPGVGSSDSVLLTGCMTKQKKNKQNRNVAALFLICGLLVQGCGKAGQGSKLSPSDSDQLASSPANEPQYFEEVSNAASMAPADNENKALRSRQVKANVEALKNSLKSVRKTISLVLFNGERTTVTVDSLQILAANNLVMTGKILGNTLSSVTLVIRDNVVMANLHQGIGNRYTVEYANEGTHRVSELSDADSEDCETMEVPADERAASAQSFNGNPEDSLMSAQTTSGSKIVDMLVAYTPAARYKVGGTTAMLAKIQMGIADTNKAFTNSGGNLQVRLAGTLEVRQNDTGNFSNDLSYLKGKTDGRWDEVHAKRSAVGADQVTMVGMYSGSSTAGIGYIRATASSAFTVVKQSAFSIYTFSHELGHNIGLQHSDGYVNSSGGFRTIMAYGSVPRILRYSNPGIAYNGYRTGTSSQNSTYKLNLYGPSVADFILTKFSSSTSILADSDSNQLR